MDDATNKSLRANQKGVPKSEAKKLKARIRELERLFGNLTMKVEVLKKAVALARRKQWILGGYFAR